MDGSWITEAAKLIAATGVGYAVRAWEARRSMAREKEALARVLIAVAARIAASMTVLVTETENAQASSAVRELFGSEVQVARADDLSELSTRVREISLLDQITNKKWRDAYDAVYDAQKLFDFLKAQSVLAGQKRALLEQLAALTSALLKARAELVEGAKALDRYAASDTREALRELLSEEA